MKRFAVNLCPGAHEEAAALKTILMRAKLSQGADC